ncbi:DUF1963 domain-containing protein [Deinococcus sp. A31D244]|uniref:DUF1963 domain-containing protein n=1 Tax=Deinococcus sp. A31D244 TaxID=3397675 RepID=UPI0039E084AD
MTPERHSLDRDAQLRDDLHRVRSVIPDARDQIEREVQAATGSPAPSLLAQAFTPVIYLHRIERLPPVQEERRVGPLSHQGGFPRGVSSWPQHEGKPQRFLLGIRLSELMDHDHDSLLPPKGWLNFFMARNVTTGKAPLTACTVVFYPEENPPPLLPPSGATRSLLRLRCEPALHRFPQAYEFATQGEYEAALMELNAIQPGYRGHPHHAPQQTDYLLGKQRPSNRLGLEVDRDVAAFAREQHGRPDTRLRALLSLTSFNRNWPFFEESRVLSVTFFIEESDLRAHRFDRVIVDVVSL